jgi:LETM1 and EF-hand domain-containing protein 1
MLPSTFQEQSKEQEKLKKKLKAKLEVAKFLQDTLEETALKATADGESSKLSERFSSFMKKIRLGHQPSTEEIMKFSSLFENELTLDNLSRQQLIALCKVLDVNTLANIPPNHILRFQLRMKLRSLEADDITIINEGVENLDQEELQTACRDRGMPALGLSEEKLRKQLEQWLDLHINRKIPITLLVLSRALYISDSLAPEDIIKTTLSSLPKSIEDATIAKVSELSGAKVDNQIKLELLKQEEIEIKLEKAAHEKEVVQAPVPAMKPEPVVAQATLPDLAAQQLPKETLVDKAPVTDEPDLTPVDIKEINQIIESLPVNEKIQVKADIEELKKDVSEYKEDVREAQELTTAIDNTAKLTETKSAKLLSKRVDKLIAEVDNLVKKIEHESVGQDKKEQNIVSIEELMLAIKKFRGISDDLKEKKLLKVLQTLDKDKDGKIDDINDVLRVFDLIEQEKVKVSRDQLSKILNLLEKEKLIELEEEKKELANKQTKTN